MSAPSASSGSGAAGAAAVTSSYEVKPSAAESSMSRSRTRGVRPASFAATSACAADVMKTRAPQSSTM